MSLLESLGGDSSIRECAGADGRRRCNVRIQAGHGAISDVNIVHCWLWRIKRFLSLFLVRVCAL